MFKVTYHIDPTPEGVDALLIDLEQRLSDLQHSASSTSVRYRAGWEAAMQRAEEMVAHVRQHLDVSGPGGAA